MVRIRIRVGVGVGLRLAVEWVTVRIKGRVVVGYCWG